MRLPPELIHAVPLPLTVDCFQSPLQAGLSGSPWHVSLASMLLCRARRNAAITARMFEVWPTPELMAASDNQLQELLRPLGLYRQRARQIQLVSRRWFTDTWSDLRDLPGVGEYVSAAVELFCYGCTYNAGCDYVLEQYADRLACPNLGEAHGRWFVDGDEFATCLDAYAEYCSRKASAQAEADDPHIAGG